MNIQDILVQGGFLHVGSFVVKITHWFGIKEKFIVDTSSFEDKYISLSDILEK